ncbi:small-conductance mechanosensitive channel [Anseongella ginsenosidimutans]|uniref:Small-conductance mechanosensitive channel n=1 Tax=Anseongella ginsenosidimutans TaxID=496056 RepID=A0A4R3KUU9_9SPHI|nr:mechanosensitive ion channel domain-containing protein [Anseongella ginsenosidimutans]QEC51843.1 mechanosensitive ion channel [Anseongella ginsenosidimutans]TCS89219.1 small-conductance mechanosensitive channel [Anseongella ginsenosidimutans]
MEIETGKKEEVEVKTINSVKRHHKAWLGTYILLALASLALYFIFSLNLINGLSVYMPLVRRAFLAAFFIFTVLSISKYTQALIIRHTEVKGVKYNLIRLIRILALLAIFMIVIAFLFKNWYTAAVSLGLVSLILGFALQTPISSFIGWLYIIIRSPYKIGDRIQVGDFKGDVVEIGYLDTTLWEFSGDYLSNDLPSGRLIRFPNTMVLETEVYNYSWRQFPYIWNEIPFHIAYESDFAFVEEVLKRTTSEVLGTDVHEKVKELKILIRQTPVDELTIREYPFVTFRTNSNTWVEAAVNYLVDPKKASGVRSSIIKNAVAALLQEPDRVMFPKSNSR